MSGGNLLPMMNSGCCSVVPCVLRCFSKAKITQHFRTTAVTPQVERTLCISDDVAPGRVASRLGARRWMAALVSDTLEQW